MSWLLWTLACLGGYEAVAILLSRWTYREFLFEEGITYTKQRHAGKAWGVAHLWGPVITLGPPCLVLYGAGWVLFQLIDLAHGAVAWYIKTDDLSRPAKAMKPHVATTAALTELAEAELAEVNKEVAALQARPGVPEEVYGDGWKRSLNLDGSVLWTPRNNLGDE